MIHSNERTLDTIELVRRTLSAAGIDFRVAAPGIIQSVDYDRQTCTVQLAIREQLNNEGTLEWVEIPTLPDVPFFRILRRRILPHIANITRRRLFGHFR